MPVLKNARWELFAQNLAKGMSQERAYVGAGYKQTPRSRTTACDLLRAKPCISERVAELQGRNVEIADGVGAMTTAKLLAMAEQARDLAMQQHQPAAAVSAIQAIAKLSGLWIEKSEVANKTADLDSLSDDQLAAIIRQGQPEVPPNPGANKKLN